MGNTFMKSRRKIYAFHIWFFVNLNGLTMESHPHEWVDAFIPRYVFFLIFFLLFIILALTNIVLLSILGGKEKKLSLSLVLETGAGSPT